MMRVELINRAVSVGNQSKLLTLLSDGHFHSGEELGVTLGISRTAVWKQIQALEKLKLDVHAVRGKGYRLSRPIELLSNEFIDEHLDVRSKKLLSKLEIIQKIDSTNRHIMNKAVTGIDSGYACLAEYQTSGRGRQGRQWVSPFASNIYLSVAWNFTLSPTQISALALAIGIAVVRALEEIGLNEAGLKWPNDVLWQGKKLAGVLLEMSGESSGPCCVVVGVGLNVSMPDNEAIVIDQPWIDLEKAMSKNVSRNRMSALLLNHVLAMCEDYQKGGFDTFIDEWRQKDLAFNKRVALDLPTGKIRGIARGIDNTGALLIESEGETRRYVSGDMSLRLG